MKEFLEKIRKPKTGIPLKRQLAATVGIILLGVTLGVLQKWLDATAANTLCCSKGWISGTTLGGLRYGF